MKQPSFNQQWSTNSAWDINPARPTEVAIHALSRAAWFERLCSDLYQLWAYRFRPYGDGISDVLAELAAEEREHSRNLNNLHQFLIRKSAYRSANSEMSMLEPCLNKWANTYEHFFVVTPVMAVAILETALAIELVTSELIKNCETMISEREFSCVCANLYERESAHASILAERLEYERQKIDSK